MHFLNQIVSTPELEDPANNYRNVHRHFYRYSRGSFQGPALKISKTASKMTLKGSFEYEDLIQEIVAISIPDAEVEVNGNPLQNGSQRMLGHWIAAVCGGGYMNYYCSDAKDEDVEKIWEIMERKGARIVREF